MAYSIDTEKYIGKLTSFCSRYGVKINLKKPKTIQDKIAWLNIYDTNPLKTKCADKILLRDYCKEILGEDLCISILKIYNSSDEIDFNELPNQFVIKCNHGSGMNIIVKDKSKLNANKTRQQLDLWMKCDFSLKNGFEAHYHDIKHKIFIEEYKTDAEQIGSLFDYKFWCFNGEPKFYTINEGHGHGPIIHYTMSQKKSSLERTDYKVPPSLNYKQPLNFNEMVDLSKKLSEPFKFVRVDFYEINGRVYLGEMTFTPGACGFKYKHRNDDIRIGNLLDIHKNE